MLGSLPGGSTTGQRQAGEGEKCVKMKQYQLKEVSKAKLKILEKYFPAWVRILGSRNPTLVFVDCFAGAGRYPGGEEGSPLLILQKARDTIQDFKSSLTILVIFVEKNKTSAKHLKANILKGLPESLKVAVFNEDAHDFIPKLLEAIPRGMPAFFFIDPYGHPLTIPVMNQILSRPRTEILLNLMWYAINMHLSNPRTRQAIDKMFGHSDWYGQPFMWARQYERENQFVDYFLSQLEAHYKLKFRIRFSPEDDVPGGWHRTKYYLIHLSNHPKAALLMKEVMWSLGDEMGTFDFSARPQKRLFPQTPQVDELIQYLQQHYVGSGRVLTFGELREETWELPFIRKHYRKAIRHLEGEGKVWIERVKSQRTGIRDKNKLHFVTEA